MVQTLQWAVLVVRFDYQVRWLVMIVVCAASAEVVQQVESQLSIMLGVFNRLNLECDTLWNLAFSVFSLSLTLFLRSIGSLP